MKKRLLAITALAGLATFVAKTQQRQESNASDETIRVDLSAGAQPFPHFWERTFGSGRANLSLRDDYRRDLRTVKKITDFEYVRFHAILDDENGVYNEDAQGRPVYNFSYVDQIYDGLLENGVKPFVEISFMPRKLAANLTPHPFWYKPLPSPPNDPSKWAALIDAFTRHLLERYGASEVEQWYFEVWNEPNIDFWNGVPKQQTYFVLYDETAKAIKRVDAHLRVGGPATAQAAWVDVFIKHCLDNHVPFDFVSTHVYGNEDSQNVFGRKLPILRRDMVARSAKKVFDQVKSSGAPKTPIIWSEYNATYMSQPEITDSAFMGPWLANNIRECDGLTEMMSYWTFSDVFEEQGIVRTPFYGGYGLIAERGIPKAAFYAFEMLHTLGDRRLRSDSEDALVTERTDGTVVIALWNYGEPGEQKSPKAFHISATGGHFSKYREQLLDPDHGSSLKVWKEMGGPATPTLQQVRKIISDSALPAPRDHAIADPVVIPTQGLALVELRK
ncbi:MAG TPA: glycosyl hydrolase family 39 [Bryobacteraceae bacterium]|nr:glycosyl hydrolase family 39 [Bryobacteraceae bacterium]